MSLTITDLALSSRLTGITADLRPGEITAICGPNGAGKSTLLACLAGLLEPDRGAVVLDDAPLLVLSAPQRAQAIGYLPQQGEVAWDVSVETLAGLGRLPWRSAAATDAVAVAAALRAMQLEALRDRPLSTLSGGEKARALLARVLAGEPRWLLADEPLANLDMKHQQALLALFRGLARDQGMGVVLVMHDLAQAMNHADRVLVIGDGALIADAPPAQALTPATIAEVWGITARWLGDTSQRALLVEGC